MIGLTPDIIDAYAARHGVLALTFADGLQGEVGVLERMRGPVFDQARTPDGFRKVRVDGETGTVTWPGGADLAPGLPLLARGAMSPRAAEPTPSGSPSPSEWRRGSIGARAAKGRFLFDFA